MTMFFPSLMLSLTPFLDLVRLLTHNPLWTRLAFWSALCGALVAAVALVPAVIDWATADRGSRARLDGAAPLMLHVAALFPLALGVVERVVTRLEVWPMALAIAGGVAWLLAAWMREERPAARARRPRPARPVRPARRGYQPTGLPSSA